jgi:hypothetical protein
LSESPPPARLDIQLPVISDDFKFQVWRKMFRALMPGIRRGWLWVCVTGDGEMREASLSHLKRPSKKVSMDLCLWVLQRLEDDL